MPSRQYLWQMKQLSNGNCIICGKPRNDYRYRCDVCTAKQRVVARERRSREAAAKLAATLALTKPEPESLLQTATEPAATHRSLP
jgi:hypothetical protein